MATDETSEGLGGLAQILCASDRAEIRHAGTVTVTTPPEQWAYAARLPRDVYLGSLTRGTVYIRLRVTEGQIGAGILTSDGRSFLVERVIVPSTDPQLVSLPIVQRDAGDLVVRNAASAGKRSRVVLYQVSTVPAYEGHVQLGDLF